MRTSIHSKKITPRRKRLLAELQYPSSTTEIFHLKARFLLHPKLLVIQSAPRGRLCMWESQSCCCHNKISLILSFIATRDDVHTKALDWVLHLDAIEGMLGAEGVVSWHFDVEQIFIVVAVSRAHSAIIITVDGSWSSQIWQTIFKYILRVELEAKIKHFSRE